MLKRNYKIYLYKLCFYFISQRKAIYKEGTSCFVEEIPPDVTYASTVEDILQHENDILNIEDEFNLQALPAPPNKQLLASTLVKFICINEIMTQLH